MLSFARPSRDPCGFPVALVLLAQAATRLVRSGTKIVPAAGSNLQNPASLGYFGPRRKARNRLAPALQRKQVVGPQLLAA
jgi:hypothetical protein